MKVFFNRRIRHSPWGGGAHFVSGLAAYLEQLGHQVVNTFDNDVDVILMIDPRDEEGFGDINQLIKFKQWLIDHGRKVKVIHRINDTDIARGTNFLVDLNIRANYAIADETVFISNWLRKHYEDHGFGKNSHVITNGCNREWFYPRTTAREPGPIRVVTHHWSDNYNKGFDAYIELDKQLANRNDIEFTYVGRYYKGYKPTRTKIIEPLYGSALGNELRKHDVYLTAARWEACGMHHIEGSSCGLPVAYHEEGGGVNEICEPHGLMFDDVSNVCKIIEEIFSKRDNLISLISYEKLDNKTTNNAFLTLMQE